jgi:hypothetical protein
MDDFKVNWKPEEREAIRNLAIEQEMGTGAVLRQALRLYQMHHHRLRAGETCHWSGDAQRMQDFAGAVLTAKTDPVVLRGCVCPAGAEAGCKGWNCPRRGPQSEDPS